jgi:hypothetical protein
VGVLSEKPEAAGDPTLESQLEDAQKNGRTVEAVALVRLIKERDSTKS